MRPPLICVKTLVVERKESVPLLGGLMSASFGVHVLTRPTTMASLGEALAIVASAESTVAIVPCQWVSDTWVGM